MDLNRCIFACFLYSQTLLIRVICIIRFIFASKYLHKFACKYSFSRNGDYLLQNIRLEANIRKTLSEYHIQANISQQIFTYKRIIACKYSHTSEYSLSIASNYIRKAFSSLRPQLIFVFLIFASFCLKIFALKLNKQNIR